MRECLWTVLEFLALEIDADEVLNLLKIHTHLLANNKSESDGLWKVVIIQF